MDDDRLAECADVLIEAARAWLAESADVDLSLGVSFSRRALRNGCFASVPLGECERLGLLELSGMSYKLSRPMMRRLRGLITGDAALCPISMNELESQGVAVNSPPTSRSSPLTSPLLHERQRPPPRTSVKRGASSPLRNKRVPTRARPCRGLQVPPGFDAVFGVPLLQDWSIRTVEAPPQQKNDATLSSCGRGIWQLMARRVTSALMKGAERLSRICRH